MNSFERTWARLDGKSVDRLPALPIFMIFACELISKKYSDFVRDHRILVEANMVLVERYGIDVVSCCSDPYAEASDCGATLEYFENQPPACREHLLHGPQDLAKLKQPDPHAGGRMSERLKAIRLYRQHVGQSIPVQGWVEGPLAQAADLRGLNELLLETAIELDFVRDSKHLDLIVQKVKEKLTGKEEVVFDDLEGNGIITT
jgi:uroporphyrinogen-III decarboxylase